MNNKKKLATNSNVKENIKMEERKIELGTGKSGLVGEAKFEMSFKGRKYFEMAHKKVTEELLKQPNYKRLTYGGRLNTFMMKDILEDWGIEVETKCFSWEASTLCDWESMFTFRIGVKTIELTKYMTLDDFIYKFCDAIDEQLYVHAEERTLMSFIINDHMIGTTSIYSTNIIEKTSLKELIRVLNESRYCNDTFESFLTEHGYKIKEDELGYKYIDTCEYRENSKIYMELLDKAHTLYRKKVKRERIEVLYLLHCLNYDENIFGDEF